MFGHCHCQSIQYHCQNRCLKDGFIRARIQHREEMPVLGQTLISLQHLTTHLRMTRTTLVINVRCTGSRNLSFNGLKQREIELEEGSARVSWYETELLIGQPNGGSPKLFFLKLFVSLKTQNI